MKALYYSDWEKLELADLPPPPPAPGEVTLKVAACGICGSELETFKTRNPRRTPPLIMGHEFCGEIAALGPAVSGWSVGQRAVCAPLITCGACALCRRGLTHLCRNRKLFGMDRPGGFAEQVNVPAANLIPWPEGLPALAACLAEPLGNCTHIVALTRHLAPRRVLIIGAGPIGLMSQLAFQGLLGCETTVADLSVPRLAVAQSIGAHRVIPAATENVLDAVRELTDGEGMDLVVDAVGTEPTKRQSIDALRPGGTAVWLGLHANTIALESYGVTLGEKQVQGTYSTTPDDMRCALELMTRPAMDMTRWLTAVPIEEGVAVFTRLLTDSESIAKAVLLPGSRQD